MTKILCHLGSNGPIHDSRSLHNIDGHSPNQYQQVWHTHCGMWLFIQSRFSFLGSSWCPGVLLYLWFALQNFLKLEDLSIFSTLLLWTKVVLKFPWFLIENSLSRWSMQLVVLWNITIPRTVILQPMVLVLRFHQTPILTTALNLLRPTMKNLAWQEFCRWGQNPGHVLLGFVVCWSLL